MIMSFVRTYIILAILLFWIESKAQGVGNSLEAKKAYSELELTLVMSKNVSLEDSVPIDVGSSVVEEQIRVANYRNLGRNLWKKFPNDPKRFIWLERAVNLPYYYWTDLYSAQALFNNCQILPFKQYSLLINWKELGEWEQEYANFKRELFANCEDTRTKFRLLLGELRQFLRLSLNAEYRTKKGFDFRKLKALFESVVDFCDRNKSQFKRNDYRNRIKSLLKLVNLEFISSYKQMGVDEKDLRNFFNLMMKSHNPALRQWALQKNELLGLRGIPFQLKYKTIDGRDVDLEKLRGKVVLINFWATWCTGCIKKMSTIKAVYEKYQFSGFEVVSVSVNYESDLEEVKNVNKSLAVSWPTLIIGGKYPNDTSETLMKTIWRKFGFTGVPQLLLFDKRGNLSTLNDELLGDNYEQLIVNLLDEK